MKRMLKLQNLTNQKVMQTGKEIVSLIRFSPS